MQYGQKASAVPIMRCTQAIIIHAQNAVIRPVSLLEIKKMNGNFSKIGNLHKSGTRHFF
jgi:hypothetical protein